MDEIQPGERLRRAVYAAASLEGVRATEPEVGKATGVSRGALRRLFAGGEPDGEILSRIASRLATTPEALIAAREGRTPDGLGQIATEIRRLREALVPGADTGLSQAAARAVAKAREDQPGGPGDDLPSGPVAFVPRRRSPGGTPLR